MFERKCFLQPASDPPKTNGQYGRFRLVTQPGYSGLRLHLCGVPGAALGEDTQDTILPEDIQSHLETLPVQITPIDRDQSVGIGNKSVVGVKGNIAGSDVFHNAGRVSHHHDRFQERRHDYRPE